MSEHTEQVKLFRWADLQASFNPELDLMFAIPNGAKLPYTKVWRRGKLVRVCPQARWLKAEGMRPGVWDIFLPVARGGYNGLFIEMKFSKNRLTAEQIEFGDTVKGQGYQAVVCHGYSEAKEAIMQYLAG
jgi:hypothetical protein